MEGEILPLVPAHIPPQYNPPEDRPWETREYVQEAVTTLPGRIFPRVASLANILRNLDVPTVDREGNVVGPEQAERVIDPQTGEDVGSRYYYRCGDAVIMNWRYFTDERALRDFEEAGGPGTAIADLSLIFGNALSNEGNAASHYEVTVTGESTVPED